MENVANLTLTGASRTTSEKSDSVFMKKIGLRKVCDYLYEVEYDDWDYTDAMKYFKAHKYVPAACSAVRNGNFFGRNFDWNYDDSAEFIVRSKSSKGRHGSIGVASSVPSLTNEVAESGVYHESYKMLPCFIRDGINDAGVVCNINVVPVGDNGYTTGDNGDGMELCGIMLVRYILDYANSADHAIELIRGLNLYMPHSDTLTREVHFMIADKNKTYVVEYVNNELVVIDNFVDDKPIMTNFYLAGFDGTRESLTPHAAGIERYNILHDNYDDGATKNGMIGLMQSVYYTKTYDREMSPFWYSEYYGDFGESVGDFTIDTPDEDLDGIVDYCITDFNNRVRSDGKTWQTVHLSVFDIENKRMTVLVQESESERYEYGFNSTADMDKNYVSQDSLNNLLSAIADAIGGSFTKSWDDVNKVWTFTYTE